MSRSKSAVRWAACVPRNGATVLANYPTMFVRASSDRSNSIARSAIGAVEV